MCGSTYGVAKSASCISVKVFSGTSSTTAIIMDGFTWAANDIINNGRTAKSVINMSLGGGYSSSFNSLVNSASSYNVVSVVAAGNDGSLASSVSPASASTAITVGAITSTWSMASYSNYGSAVDIFAPGSSVTSAWIGSTSATNTISGTSMASPHVAGLVMYMQSVYGYSGVSSITSAIKSLGTTNSITSLGSGSPNLIAYNGYA